MSTGHDPRWSSATTFLSRSVLGWPSATTICEVGSKPPNLRSSIVVHTYYDSRFGRALSALRLFFSVLLAAHEAMLNEFKNLSRTSFGPYVLRFYTPARSRCECVERMTRGERFSTRANARIPIYGERPRSTGSDNLARAEVPTQREPFAYALGKKNIVAKLQRPTYFVLFRLQNILFCFVLFNIGQKIWFGFFCLL